LASSWRWRPSWASRPNAAARTLGNWLAADGGAGDYQDQLGIPAGHRVGAVATFESPAEEAAWTFATHPGTISAVRVGGGGIAAATGGTAALVAFTAQEGV
jgi:hypothetical protein